MRTELLFAVSASGTTGRGCRHVDVPSRVPLRPSAHQRVVRANRWSSAPASCRREVACLTH